MRIIQAGFEILAATPDLEKVIELGGRVCYKSEDKITDESAEKFVAKIRSINHESVLEHGSITVKFVVDRGVSHELVRHRLASFSQESTRYCVAGETLLNTTNPHNRLTVSDLFANKTASRNGAWKRMRIRQLNERTGELEYANVEDVFYMGEKPTITVTTKLGYKLTLTNDHEVYTRDGYIQAGELSLSSDVAVNGTENLYQNEAWLRHQYTVLNKTAVQIADEFDFNVSTVKKWVRKHGLPSKPHSYWNKGCTPWNKYASETDPRVAAQANALREHHWDKGRVTVAKANRVVKPSEHTYHKLVGDSCELCSSTEALQIHHVDENRDNNTRGNLKTLCTSCHQRVHSKNLEVVHYDRVVSIEDGGVVPVYDISMASEFHNFIADGVVVHNCNYGKDKFGNEITVIDIRGGFPNISLRSRNAWAELCRQAEIQYFEMLDAGSTAQEARAVLPNSLKTEVVMTANPREWRHVFKLRCAEAAHPQMREVMLPLRDQFAKRWPALFADLK